MPSVEETTIPPRPSGRIPDLLTDKTPKIISVLIKLKGKGYRESTIEGIDKALRQMGKRCNLDNPDSVLKYVAYRDCSEARKEILCNAYSHYCRIHEIPFEKPTYEKTEKVPFTHLEQDIDSLISAVPFRTSVFLQALKETGARAGGLWKLTIKDIDFDKRIIYINQPEKRSNSRAIRVSRRLVNMI